jgi:hypothetical protein
MGGSLSFHGVKGELFSHRGLILGSFLRIVVRFLHAKPMAFSENPKLPVKSEVRLTRSRRAQPWPRSSHIFWESFLILKAGSRVVAASSLAIGNSLAGR